MSLATKMQALATKLLQVDRFGNSATFSHPTRTYDRTTGKTTTTSTATLVTTIGGPSGVNPKLVNGTTVKESDQVVYVEASQLTFVIDPAVTSVTINSKTYAITEVTPYRVNDIDVAMRLVIR